MKKLRTVITSVIVLAIVAGAFAFKTKVGAFCITTDLNSNNCTTFKQGWKITTALSGISYKYACTWDGDIIACTRANNNLCTCAAFKLTID